MGIADDEWPFDYPGSPQGEVFPEVPAVMCDECGLRVAEFIKGPCEYCVQCWEDEELGL